MKPPQNGGIIDDALPGSAAASVVKTPAQDSGNIKKPIVGIDSSPAPSEKTEVQSSKGKVQGEKLEVQSSKGEVQGEKLEVQNSKGKVQGEKLEVQSSRLEVQSPKSEVRGERPVVATIRLQPKADRPMPLNIEPQSTNVKIQDDTAESPRVEAVVIPTVVPMPQDAPVVQATSATIEIDPAAASVRTSELTEAATAVAETISVTPALTRSDGEVVIRLKPTVLDGSEIRVEAKGSTITININPATAEVAQIVEHAQAQFAQQLAERMPSFQFMVATVPRQTYDKKATSHEAS